MLPACQAVDVPVPNIISQLHPPCFFGVAASGAVDHPRLVVAPLGVFILRCCFMPFSDFLSSYSLPLHTCGYSNFREFYLIVSLLVYASCNGAASTSSEPPPVSLSLFSEMRCRVWSVGLMPWLALLACSLCISLKSFMAAGLLPIFCTRSFL